MYLNYRVFNLYPLKSIIFSMFLAVFKNWLIAWLNIEALKAMFKLLDSVQIFSVVYLKMIYIYFKYFWGFDTLNSKIMLTSMFLCTTHTSKNWSVWKNTSIHSYNIPTQKISCKVTYVQGSPKRFYERALKIIDILDLCKIH